MISDIFYTPYIDEMADYDPLGPWRSSKAREVYWHCVSAGKHKLADKIEAKYRIYLYQCDLAVAYGFSLFASGFPKHIVL